MVPLSFAGADFTATRDGALFCHATKTLLVADLHLEKASWFARNGQMLPPYDSIQTLSTLRALVDELCPDQLWCLGDNFHDADGPGRLSREAREALESIGRATDLNWIVGNHDPVLTNAFGGSIHAEGCIDHPAIGPVFLRHIADKGSEAPEISGHFHPKIRLALRGRNVSRPCFVRAGNRLILPAFGSLTGGMDAFDPAISVTAGKVDEAMVVTAGRLTRFAAAAQIRL